MGSSPIKRQDRQRLAILSIATFLLLSALVAQFFRIQIIEGPHWCQIAQAQHQTIIEVPFKRGTFWSNVAIKEGHPARPQPLVMDVPKFHLHIDPLAIPPACREEIAQEVWKFLDLSEGDWEEFRAHFDKRSRNRRLAMWLDRESRDALIDWWRPVARSHKIASNALFFVHDFQRSYPFGKLLGQVLHTIRDFKDEETKQGVPTGGLEAYFNEVLKGRQGRQQIHRSPRQQLAIENLLEEPEDGADVFLTINHYLQAIAEEEVEQGVKRSGAQSGWAVVMAPDTGEILALAQYPFFYPARYRDYFNDPQKIKETRSKPVGDPYEPGSIMKPLVLAICLTANEELARQGKPPLFDPDGKMAVSDGRFPGRSRPFKDTASPRFLNADMAIQRSSNIYPGRLVHLAIDRMGSDWYLRQLSELFGLGQKTGVELPGEASGLLPKPGVYYSNGRAQWSQSTPSAIAIGYNLLATTLQMARAYAILANGGWEVQPTLVKEIVKGDNSIVGEAHLEERKRLLSPTAVERTVRAMRFVTRGNGASRLGRIPGYSEVGKSGTALKLSQGQYLDNLHMASFVGFAPANQPRLVIAVAMDGTKMRGGQASAPVFREIARRSLSYLGVASDDPYGYPAGDPRHDPDKGYWLRETRQLQEIYERWNNPI
jgi:cell division protein FtsI (penicillin-binding protein 3)